MFGFNVSDPNAKDEEKATARNYLEFPQFVRLQKTETSIFENDTFQDMQLLEDMRKHVIAMSNYSQENVDPPAGLVSLKHIVSQQVIPNVDAIDRIESYVLLSNPFEADIGSNAGLDKTFIVKRMHLIFNDREC